MNKETRKIKNLVVKIDEVTESMDEQGNFQKFLCTDENDKSYVFSLREGWFNYGCLNEGDVVVIKSARMFEASPSLTFLYYPRFQH